MADADKGEKPATDVEAPRPKRVRSIWGVSYIKRKLKERAAKKKEEPATDKAARITATATKWMAVFTFLLFLVTAGTLIILKNQLQEMRGSGTQTDKIISAANLIEDHQKQMVKDNKQVLIDNRNALSDSLKENRAELGRVLQQNRDALNASAAQSKAALDATVTASNDQNKILSNQFDLSQRPWLAFEQARVSGPLIFDPSGPNTGAQLGINALFKNSGNSPATDVVAEAEIYGGPSPLSEMQRFCNSLSEKPAPYRHTVFPNQPIDEGLGARANTAEINRGRMGNMIAPNIIICVVYQSTFNVQARYHTAVIFDLFRIDPTDAKINLALVPGTNLEANQLKLVFGIEGGVSAK